MIVVLNGQRLLKTGRLQSFSAVSLGQIETAYRYAVSLCMIKSFSDRRTKNLFDELFVREFQGMARPAKRKLAMIDAAARLDDLLVPPANRLEKLHGNLEGDYAIRINDQWRVIYRLKNVLSSAP